MPFVGNYSSHRLEEISTIHSIVVAAFRHWRHLRLNEKFPAEKGSPETLPVRERPCLQFGDALIAVSWFIVDVMTLAWVP